MIKLGNEVKCRVTDFAGIATARLTDLDGSIRYCVEPKVKNLDIGMYPKQVFIDEKRLRVVGKGICDE